jgi:hypothetical protein
MSKALDIAEQIKGRLEADFARTDAPVSLVGLDVVVDKQKDILAEVNKAVKKATGALVSILWTGFGRDPERGRVYRYTIFVWSRPIMNAGNKPADDITERIDESLNFWVPPAASASGHTHYEMRGTGAELLPDKSYLLYEMQFTVKR